MSHLPTSPHKDFEGIKKIDEDGDEYWEARELQPLLDYKEWRNFEKIIKKAMTACSKSGQKRRLHFVESNKVYKTAKGRPNEGMREVMDYKLSRYACYLIAQNGDSKKPVIARAQTYFAVQTRRQEVMQQLSEDEKRLLTRGDIKVHNKKLFKTSKEAGVTDFGKFDEMGYLGLYGMKVEKIKQKKGIGKDDILDRAGSVELAANLFRITQTEEKIKKDRIKGQGHASLTHFSVGTKVRKIIEEIGGTMPEDLPSETHIKRVQSKKKATFIKKKLKKLTS